MRTDVKKCGAHNVVHGLRETCPKCAEAKRREVLARAPAKSAPWGDLQPPDWTYPASKYDPNQSPLAMSYTFDPKPLGVPYTDEVRATIQALFSATEGNHLPKTPAGRLAVLEDFAAAGFFGPAEEPEPFSPETFCPPGREALRRAGYECTVELLSTRHVLGLMASHGDSSYFYEEVPGSRLLGDQAERFLAFAWETLALDAGLDGILALIEEEEDE